MSVERNVPIHSIRTCRCKWLSIYQLRSSLVDFFLRKFLISREMEGEEKIRRNKSTADWHAETLFIKQHFSRRFSSASLIHRHVRFITNVANFYDFFFSHWKADTHWKKTPPEDHFCKHFVNMIHQSINNIPARQ